MVARESDLVEEVIKASLKTLKTQSRKPEADLKEALLDISRRPTPDLTGAIHHAMAALECLS